MYAVSGSLVPELGKTTVTPGTFNPRPCTVSAIQGAKSLARPGRKQATATDDFDVHISYLLS